EAGARLSADLGAQTSPDTLLRIVRQAPLPEVESVRAVGIDDWCWRKGQRYGTILVDLEQHRIVDLLPDRYADSVAAWLAQHPEMEVIARDRGGVYADGARRGAPDAVQVADRFHVPQNLTGALERLLQRHHPDLREAAAVVDRQRQAEAATIQSEARVAAPAEAEPGTSVRGPAPQASHTAPRQRRLARSPEVRPPRDAGVRV